MEALTREQFEKMIQEFRNGNEPPLWEEIAALRAQLAACEQRLVAMREQFKSSSTDEENTLRKQLATVTQELQNTERSREKWIADYNTAQATIARLGKEMGDLVVDNGQLLAVSYAARKDVEQQLHAARAEALEEAAMEAEEHSFADADVGDAIAEKIRQLKEAPHAD